MCRKSITITGDLGSGKSTVAKILAQRLGYIHYSTGDAWRQIASEMGMTALELNKYAEKDKSIDTKIDSIFAGLGKDGKLYAIDSRLAWHFMSNTLKVKLTVNPVVGAERIFNDKERSGEKKYQNSKEAYDYLIQRRKSEVERYKEYYHIDIEDNSNFDLIIDSSDKTPEEIADIIIRFLSEK